jgi:hypothetical protein
VSQLYDQKDQCEAESNDLSAFNHPIFGSQAQRKEMRVGGDGEDGDPDEVRVEVESTRGSAASTSMCGIFKL